MQAPCLIPPRKAQVCWNAGDIAMCEPHCRLPRGVCRAVLLRSRLRPLQWCQGCYDAITMWSRLAAAAASCPRAVICDDTPCVYARVQHVFCCRHGCDMAAGSASSGPDGSDVQQHDSPVHGRYAAPSECSVQALWTWSCRICRCASPCMQRLRQLTKLSRPPSPDPCMVCRWHPVLPCAALCCCAAYAWNAEGTPKQAWSKVVQALAATAVAARNDTTSAAPLSLAGTGGTLPAATSGGYWHDLCKP